MFRKMTITVTFIGKRDYGFIATLWNLGIAIVRQHVITIRIPTNNCRERWMADDETGSGIYILAAKNP